MRVDGCHRFSRGPIFFLDGRHGHYSCWYGLVSAGVGPVALLWHCIRTSRSGCDYIARWIEHVALSMVLSRVPREDGSGEDRSGAIEISVFAQFPRRWGRQPWHKLPDLTQ